MPRERYSEWEANHHDRISRAAFQAAAAQDPVSRACPRARLKSTVSFRGRGIRRSMCSPPMEQEYFAIRNATTLYDLTPMVKYRVAGPDALPYSIVWSPAMSPSSSRTGWPIASGATMPAISSTTAPCFVWGEMNIESVRRNARSIGCSIRRSVSTSKSARSPSRSPRSRFRGRPPAPCSRPLGLPGVEKLKPFEIGYFSLGRAID